MSSTPWWAECRQCSTFFLRDLGMTILLSINTWPLSVMNQCHACQVLYESVRKEIPD